MMYFFLIMAFISPNSADLDEMPLYATFHLGPTSTCLLVSGMKRPMLK